MWLFMNLTCVNHHETHWSLLLYFCGVIGLFYILYKSIDCVRVDSFIYEMISRVEQDISLIRFAHLWDNLVNTRNKFHFSKHPCIILDILELIKLLRSTDVIFFAELARVTKPRLQSRRFPHVPSKILKHPPPSPSPLLIILPASPSDTVKWTVSNSS